MDFGLFNYIKESVVGSEVIDGDQNVVIEDTDPNSQQNSTDVENQSQSVDQADEKDQVEEKNESQDDSKKEAEEDAKKMYAQAIELRGNSEDETSKERETRIIYHDAMKISIKCKYQVLPKTSIRDGECEEHYHVGMNCVGPIKSKVSYVNGKKHGEENLYDIHGNLTKTNYYDSGEYQNTWWETFFGK